MFFSRKAKNRRLGREHVLDVKLRSSQVRATRVRVSAIIFGTLFGTVFGIYLVWRAGEWALNRLVYGNKAFAIQNIEIQTDGVIAIEPLRRWMSVKLEENLLALDLARVKRDLELVPMIQSVSVERMLPHTLRVHVIERAPVAQVSVPRPHPGGGIDWGTLQLDAEGYVMPPLAPNLRSSPVSQSEAQLPVISGINLARLQPGRPVPNPQVQAALQLLQAFDRSPMAGAVELKHIDVSPRDTLSVTASDGSEVSFGLNDFDQQFRRWKQIFDLGQRMNKSIASLDLAVAYNIPVRWLDGGPALPPAPKSPKPPRNANRFKKTSEPSADYMIRAVKGIQNNNSRTRPSAPLIHV
ncbi:MAG: hypothetical protein C5B50_15365 [Verrucomicrobia bacterium]|nr:MAG: hypothetical protein C5B50_15365 [Verrucomicrobiota bacterium]